MFKPRTYQFKKITAADAWKVTRMISLRSIILAIANRNENGEGVVVYGGVDSGNVARGHPQTFGQG